jgi:hypothetical protein
MLTMKRLTSPLLAATVGLLATACDDQGGRTSKNAIPSQAPASSQPAPAPAVVANRFVHLNRVAAAQAAAALTDHLKGEGQDLTIAADHRANRIYLQGETSLVARGVELLAHLDKE